MSVHGHGTPGRHPEWRATLDDFQSGDETMRLCLDLARVAARTELPTLILGETGTGKTLLARALHNSSRRARGPFIAFNSAALSDTLLDSQLFGHERGAFTGADRRVKGKFELADGGTLFLDEIGDLNLEAQAKLLRTLETGVLQRLGAEQPQQVNVRVLAATNRQLEQAVAGGTFREDLFFRLNIFPIHIPPLRERLEDLPALVSHLARRARPGQPQRYDDEALALLRQHPWPGNIRELANLVERLAIIGGEVVGATEVAAILPLAARRADGPTGRRTGEVADLAGRPLTDALDDYERSLIAGALERTGGNVAEAARLLVTDRANLYRRMKRLGLLARNEPVGGER